MLTTMATMLENAKKGKYAVGAFNVPNLESVQATIAAAEELSVPVIIQHAQVHDNLIDMEAIVPIMLYYAHKALVPVAVHLDHGSDFDTCVRAMHLGFTSVMYDASAKPFADNVRETAEITKIAKALGVSVEAELGHVFTSAVGGGEGRGPVGAEDYDSLDDVYTDPEMAKTFVEQTGVDALAISFGTTHGVYLTEPKLDLTRITAIRDKIDIPFVMHGGSGVSDDDYREAIARGITKINYFTYGAMAGGKAVEALINNKGDDTVFFYDIVAAGTEGIKENVKSAMAVFATNLLQ